MVDVYLLNGMTLVRVGSNIGDAIAKSVRIDGNGKGKSTDDVEIVLEFTAIDDVAIRIGQRPGPSESVSIDPHQEDRLEQKNGNDR